MAMGSEELVYNNFQMIKTSFMENIFLTGKVGKSGIIKKIHSEV